MFGFRSDGKKVKFKDPLMRVIPHIMTARHDAQVHYTFYTETDVLDRFIEDQREKGVSFNYAHIMYACVVRMLHERPMLNRFVVNKRVYQRNTIGISNTVKKVLKDDAEEITIKNEFTGRESIFDIKEMYDDIVRKNQVTSVDNSTDKLVKFFNKLPNFVLSILVGTLKFMDKLGILPKSIIKASPFHTSVFMVNMKSIKMDTLYHHLYDFGTASWFLCLSQPIIKPVWDEESETFKPKRMLEMGSVSDERITNGLYWSNSLKLIKKYFTNPWLLLERLPEEIKQPAEEYAKEGNQISANTIKSEPEVAVAEKVEAESVVVAVNEAETLAAEATFIKDNINDSVVAGVATEGMACESALSGEESKNS